MLKPEYVRELKDKNYVDGTLGFTPTALIWGQKKNNNTIALNTIGFIDKSNCFTDDFNLLIEEAKQNIAHAYLARTKELYDSLVNLPVNRSKSVAELRNLVAIALISDNQKGMTDAVLVRQGKHKLYSQEELLEFGDFFNNGIGTYNTLENYLKGKDVIIVKKRFAFDKVGELPQFAECDGNVAAWMSQNVKYPPLAEENGIVGDVICSFMINTDGSCSDYVVDKKVDPTLDNEVIRVLKQMPKWTPGKNGNATVPVRCYVLVKFVLR